MENTEGVALGEGGKLDKGYSRATKQIEVFGAATNLCWYLLCVYVFCDNVINSPCGLLTTFCFVPSLLSRQAARLSPRTLTILNCYTILRPGRWPNGEAMTT